MWFSYDPDENDFSIHETEEQARKACEAILDYHADLAPEDGWSEMVEAVCYGKLIGRATEVRRWKDPGSRWDELIEYRVKLLGDDDG